MWRRQRRPHRRVTRPVRVADGRLVRNWRLLSDVEAVCYRQRRSFVRFQGNLLGKHDVARHERNARYKTPARLWQAGGVQLADIHSGAAPDQVFFPGVAAGNLEKVVSFKLLQLPGRQPFSQQLMTPQLTPARASIPVEKFLCPT